MAIRELKDQIARLPEQPGVYLYFNARRRHDLRRQGAGAARPRAQLPAARAAPTPRPTRCSTKSPGSKSSSPTRWSRRWRSRTTSIKQRSPKYNILLRDDKNYPYLQLTTDRAISPGPGRAAGRARRHFYAGPFLPAQPRAEDDGADAPTVRHPFVQRGHHGQARPAVPGVRHQALPRALRRHRLLGPRSTAAP